MLSLGVAGDAEEVLARCQALYRLGARHFSFGPPLGPDPLVAIRLLGSQVLPGLASLSED
jgi:5,10-methylenetetrahydromethanopterin reductase